MRKLMLISLSFAAGTALSHYLLPLPALPLAALAAAAAFLVLLLTARRRLRLLLITAALACSFLYNFAFRTWITRRVAGAAGEAVFVEAEVLDYAEAAASRYRVPVRWQGMQGMLYGGGELCALRPGETVSAVMTAADASTVRNTTVSAFTAKGYYLLFYPREELHIGSGASWARWPQRAAAGVQTLIDQLYGPAWSPLLRAILLGDRSLLPVWQESDLSEAGVYHITAVSGMHCGFLITLLALFLGRGRRLSALGIPLLWAYVLVVGCPASMVRAAVMLTMVLLGPLLGRESDGPTSLSFALLLLLLANPYAVAGVGLQLSFTAIAGLMLLTPRLIALVEVKRPVPRFLWYTAAASLATTAATAPLGAVYFNILSLAGVPANVLMLWAASLVFAVGLVSLAAGALLPPLGAALALPVKAGAAYILTLSHLIARLPCHAVYFSNPYLKYWLLYALAMLAYCLLTPKGRRKFVLAGVLASLTLVLTAALPVLECRGRLYIAAVDVGQGASAFLSSGGRTALVDCGSSSGFLDAGDTAADWMNTCGCYHLDYLILTHCHEDHANGVPVLLERMTVDTLLLPRPPEGEEDDMVVDCARACGTAVRYIEEDETLPLGAALLTLYAPVGRGSTNEEGLSVLCSAGDFDALITGDMNSTNERILAAAKDLPDIEVLFAGHHGSRYAASQTLLDAVTPEAAVVSVGENSYGHPAPETMARLARTGLALYRTDLQGTISINVY